MTKLRNILIGAGIATVGAIGVKKAVDYFQEKKQQEVVNQLPEDASISNPQEEVAFAVVETNSVQGFLDKTFGTVGRYQPNRSPKVFEYQDKNYMVIWAYDQQKSKNQMLVFVYTDKGREMIGSVGYTASETDYRLTMENTPFAVIINGKKLQSGEGETSGTNDVDFVLA
ncbi:hypothetical protein [Geminocystis herdmanii]|uniref:hypothetical protein n=1 Tax=Geminocystis herdmanii TaxID=669359 RepID=UPI00034A4798|nr:hypothetical protein [Geminocystis herdmanii]